MPPTIRLLALLLALAPFEGAAVSTPSAARGQEQLALQRLADLENGMAERALLAQKEALALQAQEERPGEPISFRKVAAEFIAMALLVFVGCGSAMAVAHQDGWLLQVSLTFGLAITVLAYTLGHYSGAQVNCAVTFGMMLAGQVGWGQGLLNVVGQLVGSVLGASVLKAMFPAGKDRTENLGTNAVSVGFSKSQALTAEFIATFLLMYVVLETAVNGDTQANASFAPIAIGLSVFLAHSVLIPIDGCSINPTRSFGPALVQLVTGSKTNPFEDMWVFWLGPLAGAAAAFGIYTAIN